MRKYLSIIISIFIVGTLTSLVIFMKQKQQNMKIKKQEIRVNNIGMIKKDNGCGQYGSFFSEKGIIPPLTIDLSQKKYKGIALYYGNNQVYHPKSWERFDYFESYATDKKGNLYLVPMPFISIKMKTFEYLSNLYKIDSDTGKLTEFMHFDDIFPSLSNPYGLNAITYDCEDETLWVSAIDESNYQTQKGVIYHIDPQNKKILSQILGWDVLSLAIIKTDKGKFLCFGSARDSGLYAVNIGDEKFISDPIKLFEIPNPQEHIRKIKVTDVNEIEVQTIPFSYTLITESSKNERTFYNILYDVIDFHWDIKKI